LWLWDVIRPPIRGPIAIGTARESAHRAATRDVVQWLGHLAEMVVAMYVGMLVYHALVIRALNAAGLGGGDLRYSGMILFMLAPMVALMRGKGHGWRMTGEMAVGMVVPILVCFGLVRWGICPLVPFLGWLSATTVYQAAHDGMLLGMIAVMVYRRGMYLPAPLAH
jgi:hypothetical protein